MITRLATLNKAPVDRDRLARVSLLRILPCLVATLTSCAATQPSAADITTPGFFFGLWHGIIAPITFILSLFPNDLRIYAFPNAGLWYDFGFMLGIGGFTGGIFAGGRRNRS